MKRKQEFKAVTAARQWKEAVARQTEGMSREQILAFFDKTQALAALAASLPAAEPTPLVNEDPG